MEIQAILFDADGVVIHPNRFSQYLEQELSLTQDETLQFFGETFRECLIGRADLKKSLAPFLPHWGWLGTIDEFIVRWFEEENAVDQRMIDFIVTLRQQGYFCGLATNQERYRLEYMKSEMGFSAIFDEIFSSAESGAMKDELHYYELVTAKLGLPAENILFWDDSQSNVEMARLFGWKTERYTTFDAFVETIEYYLSRR